MSQQHPDSAIALVRFRSREEIARFMKDLSDYYQKEAEKYGDKLGALLRTAPQEAVKAVSKGEAKEKALSKGWIKMGSVLVNTTDPSRANTEVMYLIHEELKLKLARTIEALKSFDEGANALIPESGAFQLLVRNGLPERIIVEKQEKRDVFAFEGKFRIV